MNNQSFHLKQKKYIGNVFLNAVLASIIMSGCVNSQLCTVNESSEWMVSDSIVINQLRDSLSQTIFIPDIVKCYHLSYKDSIDERADIQVVDGYVRDSLITTLNTSQIAVLQYLLPSNARNYSTGTILVQSPYRPIWEFEFVKQETLPASIVLSISDHSWQIVKEGKLQLSYNYVETKAIERFCDYFLDMYISKKSIVK